MNTKSTKNKNKESQISDNKFGIVKLGGKQYKVSPGDKIRVEKMDVKEGDDVIIESVLLRVDGDKVDVGTPYLNKAKVKAKAISQGKGKKKIVFKYKPKTRYRIKKGHRQEYTDLEIISIN